MPHGDFNHIEIPADDTARARRFYEAAFGWTFTDTQFGDYALYTTPAGEQAVGGGLGKRGDSAPDEVRVYLEVDSIDATLARVGELGGATLQGKDDIPGIGWWAVVTDTEGNKLGLFERVRS